MSVDPMDKLHEEEAEPAKKAAAEAVLRGLRKLAPDDFDEEMSAIKGGLRRAASAVTGRREQPAPDAPIPVDIAAKKSFLSSAASVTLLLAGAAFDSKKPAKPKTASKPRKPVVIEKPAPETAKPETPARAAEKTPRAVSKVLTDEQREAGKAVAHTLGGGFGEAFRGVAAGAKAIRGVIEKKVPLASSAFKAVGKAGEMAGDAARAAGQELKAAGTSAGEKVREIKDSGIVQSACKKIVSSTAETVQSAARKVKETSAQATEMAGTELKTAAAARLRSAGKQTKEAAVKAYQSIAAAARKAGESVKHAASDAGDKLNKMKSAAGTASEDAGAPLAEKLKGFSSKVKERLDAVKTGAAEKAHDLAAGAKDTLGSLRDRVPTGEGCAADKLKNLAGTIQHSARDIADKTRSKLEHFITDNDTRHNDK